MFQIIDISGKFLYNQERAKNDLLSIINASVSHELRNPLNSMNAQNELEAYLIEKLQEIAERTAPENDKDF